jgi:hypothetical protein
MSQRPFLPISTLAGFALLGVLGTRPLEALNCTTLQNRIRALPAAGGVVAVPAGVHSCRAPIVIDRDNVALRGVGPASVLRLADAAEAPVLVIGQTAAVPALTRHNIVVSDLTIDGNRTKQAFECFKGPCTETNPLRNNGISVRKASDVRIERVAIRSARSGGVVTELGCERVTLRDLTVTDSFFDGVAGYETTNSLLSGLYLHDNLAAGFSFDIDFERNVVSDVVITGSGTVGIFMRDARDNVFTGMRIAGSVQHGIFLAQVDTDVATAATGNSFADMTVHGSGGAGMRVNDASCVHNSVTNSHFFANAGGNVSEAGPGLVTQCCNVER